MITKLKWSNNIELRIDRKDGPIGHTLEEFFKENQFEKFYRR